MTNTPLTGLDEIVRIRREKAAKLASAGWPSFPNGLTVPNTSADVRAGADGIQNGIDPVDDSPTFRVSGRILRLSTFGKVTFVDLHDRTGKIQAQLKKDVLGDEVYARVKLLDLGDFLLVEGPRFRTKTGELTIQARHAQLAVKSLHPVPDAHFGLADVELRYRQRYLDLIASPAVREVFVKRTKIVRYLRDFLDARGFLEVETPMLHDLVSGAAARPFNTHHNALDMDLVMRIAPELHLKRLVVGGYERVYEINRNFRNEGLSTQHNPEFTMLEFYQAYATYEDLMSLTEEMFRGAAQHVCGTLQVPHGTDGVTLDFEKPFRRIPVRAGLTEKLGAGVDIADPQALHAAAKARQIHLDPKAPLGKLQMDLFESLWQAELVQPTFVVDFPVEVSPLARRKDSDPTLTDRFELYMTGKEVSNGFSELNDPDDQRSRFEAQATAKAGGADETMDYDADYITALEIGMPPTAGEGVGIDRLVMVLTNQPSIRDVILFPQMRKVT